MRTRRHEIRARGERVPVVEANPDGARALVFLHGYGRHPLDYRPVFEELARASDVRVLAPFLVCNNRLRRPPRSVWGCAALARRTVEGCARAGLLDGAYSVFGHSTGGACALLAADAEPAPRRLLAVNPLMPVDFGTASFLVRSLRMNLRMVTGRAGDGRRGRRLAWATGMHFYLNWLRKPCRSLGLIDGIERWTSDAPSRWYGRPVDTPARVLFGHGDEFFDLPPTLASDLGRTLRRLDVRELPEERSHEWLLVHPERAAREVVAFVYEEPTSSR